MKLSDDDNEKRNRIEDTIDQQNLDHRKLFLWGGVDDESAEKLVKRIFYLDSLNHDEIRLFINSPGGVISSGMAIIDAMQMVKSDISTICLGQAASMGAVILVLGQKGKRFVSQNSRVMIHQPLVSGQIFGPASDIQIQADEILRIRSNLNTMFAKAAGKTVEEIEQDTDRDYFMDAKEAIAYGIVDDLWDEKK